MLAHLSRKKLLGGSRFGCHYAATSLRWSGPNAAGDDFDAPVCIVIDVGRAFTMSFDGKLYLTGAGKAQYQTFTPMGLLQAARQGWFGFTLLYDEETDEPDTEKPQ